MRLILKDLAKETSVVNLRKHVAGFALFFFIVSSAILIKVYLTAPIATIIPDQDRENLLQVSTGKAQTVQYSANQVLLDVNEKRSYTGLHIQRLPGQPRPETLWVTTYFFSTAQPGKVWTTKTEIRKPFAQSDSVEVTATAMCSLCMQLDTLSAQKNRVNRGDGNKPFAVSPPSTGTGYFARVYLSTEYDDNSFMESAPFDYDIRTAIPVVIDWPDKITY